MRSLIFAVLLCALCAVPSAARPKHHETEDALESIAIEKGKCLALLTLQDDKTSACTDKLINTTWRSGRAGFYFMTAGNEAITFSGIGEGQIHPNPDVAIQPVDMVIFGMSHEKQRAVGSCRFTNPFHGKGTVDCEAVTEVGSFKGSFVTDGSEPSIKRS